MRERQVVELSSASQQDVNPPSNKEFYDRNNADLAIKTKELISYPVTKNVAETPELGPNF